MNKKKLSNIILSSTFVWFFIWNMGNIFQLFPINDNLFTIIWKCLLSWIIFPLIITLFFSHKQKINKPCYLQIRWVNYILTTFLVIIIIIWIIFDMAYKIQILGCKKSDKDPINYENCISDIKENRFNIKQHLSNE